MPNVEGRLRLPGESILGLEVCIYICLHILSNGSKSQGGELSSQLPFRTIMWVERILGHGEIVLIVQIR